MSAPEAVRAAIARAGDEPRFGPEPVPAAVVEELVAGATRSCPARFTEPPWRFVAVVGRERELLVAHVAEALARHWGLGSLGPRGLASDAVLNAPALVLALSSVPSSEGGVEAIGLVAGAVQSLILLAHAAGLGTHRIWSPHVVPEAVLDFVGERLGAELRGGELVAMLALGWPAGEREPLADPRPAPVEWIGLPGAPSRAAATAFPPKPAQVLRARRGERVLVADAYAWNREQLTAYLEAAGYRVEAFAEARALLQRVSEAGAPDLYVVSESMPDSGGFELIRKLASAGLHAPILVTTPRRDSAFRIAGLAAGVDYYLRKPVNPIELYTAARILLERHHLVDELQRKNLELGRLLGELRTTQARLVQQAKMASLGQLVAGVAHEINTPLGAVVSNNDLFLRGFARLRAALATSDLVADPRVQRDLGAIESLLAVTREACARITHIVRTLRTFARSDVTERRAVDLHEGLDSTLILLRHLLRPDTTLEKRYGQLPLVECHPNQINQVFMNLLVNASQALDGPGTIRVETEAERQMVRITVADTGRGIPTEHLERIFDPGFTTKDAGAGTGLGLMICREIVEAHGGTIAVDSAPDRGTAFTVRLPVRRTA